MIPEKETKKEAPKEKGGKFDILNVEHFIKRLIRNWYWFLLLGMLGYSISYFYDKYYVQRIYESNLSLSISNNTASYFTPNQSINFIWGQGGNQDGVFLKKMLLSRSHNEYLVQKLDLFVNYYTKGSIKETYMDKYDSPVLLEIDKNHLQQINYPITIIPRNGNLYEISLPEEGHSTNLYSYKSESFENVPEYPRPNNKIIGINQWYTSPNFKFRLVPNPHSPKIKLGNINVTLLAVNQAVNEIVSSIGVEFDKELPSIMIISKKGYNLRGTVNFLNTTVEELIKKRREDQSTVDKNTIEYIGKNLAITRAKLDSSAHKLNNLKINERLFDIEGKDTELIGKITDLEAKRADLLVKINSLNSIRNSVSKNIEGLINLNAAGVEDGSFNASVSELKALYAKKIELASIYTPNSEPMREINRLINEARNNSHGNLKKYYSIYHDELAKLNQQISMAENSLTGLPEKERKYIDIERGHKIIETTYNTLLTKQAESQMRLATNKSDLTIIDSAKDFGQGPIGPNVNSFKYGVIGSLLLLPFLLILGRELLDNKVRSIKEVVNAIRIPLLGVIGNNTHDNNLSVLEQPKSSISEAFRGVRANLRFLYNEDGKSKVILVTSSIGGEGKTYVSINIASVLGLSGKKTILLGMDLRKPKIFGDFKIDNKLGISNYLTGEVPMSQIINKTKIPDLDVATSGPIPPNPSEILMSQKNIDFIEELKKQYDFVIIDSPPVGLVADSFELMKHTDANVYVIRHEYTEKYMLRMITEKYQTHEIEHLGFIYNDFTVKQSYGYGYGYGYGYVYGYGYFDEDKNYKEPTIIKIKNKLREIFRRG